MSNVLVYSMVILIYLFFFKYLNKSTREIDQFISYGNLMIIVVLTIQLLGTIIV